MQSVFITKIHVDKVRHIKNIDIVLSENERKNLILTGKNGSGKTSLLEALRDSVLYEQKLIKPDGTRIIPAAVIKSPNISITYSKQISNFSNEIFVYISANRSKFIVPKAVEPFKIINKTQISHNASKDFLKYILLLDYQMYGAKSDNDKKLEASLEKWFDDFISALREIYSCSELKLQRDTKNLVFKIDIPGREPFGLHEMADGYSAFLDIYMELIMRFENSSNTSVNYEQPAIVMIDEIETHLHVELQKRILPFLTKLFPNVQFIVATHSPFVMTSIENAVVYDLEKDEYLENPKFYSYDAVVESFLGTSMYSNELIRYFKRYKELCLKKRSPEENEEFLQAKAEIEVRAIPSTELYLAYENLERKRRLAKNGSAI
ncbi:MAG: AAA family ATPase [Clostridiales bacterium]|jgi:predicted ATP-binding protein involved in virulence|nr:AAA family ATPase [Clostridiales bacterium]